MPLRVTRQSVEVLREADNPLTANLRVSRQAIEVMRKTAKNLTASSTLATTSTASRIGTLSPGAGNSITIVGTAELAHTLPRSAANALAVTQTASSGQPHEISETDTLSLNQAASRFGQFHKPDEGSALSLSQSASGIIVRELSAESTLGIIHSAGDPVFTRQLGAENEITIYQGFAVDFSRQSICQYDPSIGANSDPDAPEPPPTAIQGPVAGIQVPFQLVYPSTGTVTDSVSLRAPNLGNKDRLAFNRVLRETRGGTLIVFADRIWPKVQTLVLSFSGLYRVEAQALLEFLENHVGQEIGLIDWEHRYWRGVIITPDKPIVEDRFDSFSASFEFQGELDPTWNPQVVPPTERYSAIRSEQAGGYYVPREPQLPITPESTDYHSAQADGQIKIGYPVYLKTSGHVDPAQANDPGTAQVAGISISDTEATFACKYITEGRVQRTDWTEVAGTALLSAGATYFLDPLVAGRITTTAPVSSGHYVVRVGRAVTSSTLDVEIELPILL